MRVIDLFPPCTREDCPCKGRSKHIEPHQQEFFDSPAKYIYWQGGYGSGKTLPAVIKCLLLMLKVPGIRGFIGRQSLPKLHDSTQRIFMEVLERAQLDDVEFRENRDGWAHHIILPNGSEVFFRPTSDLGRFLGPEYGFFLIDEAQEEPEKTFTDLMGRLRLPLARRYLCGMLLSNPPDGLHWLKKHFGDKPGIFEKTVENVSTKWHFMRSSTRLNPHMGRSYVADLIMVHGEEEALRIIEGMYGFTNKGTPVYRPPFNHNVHIGEPAPVEFLPLIRSWDFGRRHPAVTFHQAYHCKKGQLHWTILDELSELSEIETPELAKAALEYTKERFPTFHKGLVLDCGDRSGNQKRAEGQGPIYVLRRHPYNLPFKWGQFKIQNGVDYIAGMLRKGLCGCGSPVLLVHRRCKAVCDGFAGGYHYPQTRPERAPKEDPYKDGFYDDVMDSVRYAAENFVRREEAQSDFITEILVERNKALYGGEDRLAWMGR